MNISKLLYINIHINIWTFEYCVTTSVDESGHIALRLKIAHKGNTLFDKCENFWSLLIFAEVAWVCQNLLLVLLVDIAFMNFSKQIISTGVL